MLWVMMTQLLILFMTTQIDATHALWENLMCVHYVHIELLC